MAHLKNFTPLISLLAGLLAALGVAVAPAAAQDAPPAALEDPGATSVTAVFRPAETTHYRLIYSVSGVPPEEVRSARVRLHSRRTNKAWTRRIGLNRVRKALGGNSRLVLHRNGGARGRLKLKVDDDAAPEEPPPSTEEPPPASEIPADWQRFTSFESSLDAGTQYGWTTPAPHTVTRTTGGGAADGSYAAKIDTNGGGSGCSCPRMGFEDGFSYGPGDEIWMSGSWKIPNPAEVNWSRLMNLGHYEGSSGSNWYLALESTKAGTFQVSHAPYGTPNSAILPARPIPADRWFRVDLHFELSPNSGQALSEWYIDGELVDSTTRANMYNSKPLHFFNGGLPYFWPGNGDTTVYFDAPRLTEVL